MGSKKTPSQTISFRLSARAVELLDRQREGYGVSRGEWVRGLVTAALDGSPTPGAADTEQILCKLDECSEKLQDRLAIVLYITLVTVGNVPADEAKRIVQDALLVK